MKTKRIFTLSLLLLFSTTGIFAQHPASDTATAFEYAKKAFNKFKENHSLRHPGSGLHFQKPNIDMDSLLQIVHRPHKLPKGQECGLLDNTVFGFHPGYLKTAYTSYNFSLLSHLSYFCYIVDPNTGNYKNIYDWKTTPIVEAAHAKGCKVELTLTTNGSGGRTYTMLDNPAARKTCIDSMAALIKLRAADGVTVDFEDLRTADKANFSLFIQELHKGVTDLNPGASLSICVKGGLESGMDYPALMPYTDRIIIMGYDFSYAGGKTAGATAPMPGKTWSGLNLKTSIQSYINAGVPKEKVVLALPYYGYEWQTQSSTVDPNNVVSYNKTYTYSQMRRMLENKSAEKYSQDQQSPYFIRKPDGKVYQAWIDDSTSLAVKFDLAKEEGIAGIGIWALGYDNGYFSLWNLIHAKFNQCASTSRPLTEAVPEHTKPAKVSFVHPTYHYWFFYGIGGVFIILIILVAISPKIREEVFNRHSFFYLAALITVILLLTISEFRQILPFSLSDSFTWDAVFGVAIAVIAFIIGRRYQKYLEKGP